MNWFDYDQCKEQRYEEELNCHFEECEELELT